MANGRGALSAIFLLQVPVLFGGRVRVEFLMKFASFLAERKVCCFKRDVRKKWWCVSLCGDGIARETVCVWAGKDCHW